MKKIDEEFLIEQGFVKSDYKVGIVKTLWVKKLPSLNVFISFYMNDYGYANPNCGVMGIYEPAGEVGAIPPDLKGKKHWSPEDMERFMNYTVHREAVHCPFAHFLDDQDRFKRLVDDIFYER